MIQHKKGPNLERQTNKRKRSFFLEIQNNSRLTFMKTEVHRLTTVLLFIHQNSGQQKTERVMVQHLAMNIPKIPLLKTKPLFTHV